MIKFSFTLYHETPTHGNTVTFTMPCWSCFSLCLSHSAFLNAPSYLLHPAAFFSVCLSPSLSFSLSLSSSYLLPLPLFRLSPPSHTGTYFGLTNQWSPYTVAFTWFFVGHGCGWIYNSTMFSNAKNFNDRYDG